MPMEATGEKQDLEKLGGAEFCCSRPWGHAPPKKIFEYLDPLRVILVDFRIITFNYTLKTNATPTSKGGGTRFWQGGVIVPVIEILAIVIQVRDGIIFDFEYWTVTCNSRLGVLRSSCILKSGWLTVCSVM